MTASPASGYIFALLAFTIFAGQDAISTYLGHHYSPIFISMLRYWWFAGFAILWAQRSPGGIARVARANRPFLQIARAALLAVQIVLVITSFATVGLAHSQAIFSAAPLIVAILSVPVLGERVGWRRWTAINIGLVGVLFILKPEAGFIDLSLTIAIINMVMMALYGVLTRLGNRSDTPITSFFYTGVVGAVMMTVIGPFFWQNPTAGDWVLIVILCTTGMASHYFLIRAYDLLDAVLVQPLSYLQLVFASIIGVMIFGEQLTSNVLIGSLIVVGAGLFTIWREAVTRRRGAAKAVKSG